MEFINQLITGGTILWTLWHSTLTMEANLSEWPFRCGILNGTAWDSSIDQGIEGMNNWVRTMMIRKVADFTTATSQVDVGSLDSPRGITMVSPWYHLPKNIDVNPHRGH